MCLTLIKIAGATLGLYCIACVFCWKQVFLIPVLYYFQGSGIHDIVINADPSKPPLSLFVLFELIKQKFSVLATSYVHSSVTGVDPRLVEMIKNGSQVTRGSHQLALSVVWKKGINTCTLCSRWANLIPRCSWFPVSLEQFDFNDITC